MELNQTSFDAPIAGQSLTSEVGSRPWQQPPQFAEVEEVLDHYVTRLLDPEFAPQLLGVIEMGVPLTTIANSMQIGGVMQGLHTIDIGILTIPVLIEMMGLMAEQAGIEHTTGIESANNTPARSSVVALAKNKLQQKAGMQEPMPMEQEQPMPEPEEPPSTGLMSRSIM